MSLWVIQLYYTHKNNIYVVKAHVSQSSWLKAEVLNVSGTKDLGVKKITDRKLS